MKMIRFLLIPALALMMLVSMTTSASAQCCGTTYAVGVQIKNLDTNNAATVTVTYYDQAGNPTTFNPPSINANQSYTMATLDGVSSGFNGSAVISSDREIGAIANVFGSGATRTGASYTALKEGATTINIPLVLRGVFGINSWFNVQNTNTAASASVTVTYSNGATETATIPAGAAATFNQETNTDLTDTQTNFTGFIGSAIVTSDQAIVATVLQQSSTVLQGYDGFRNADASTEPVLPLIVFFKGSSNDISTGIQIQNVSDSDTNVTLSYSPSQAGAACTETQTIQAKKSATFGLNAFGAPLAGVTENCADGETFVGSAQVTGNTGNVALVAIANQVDSMVPNGAAYGSFSPDNATDTVDLPLILDHTQYKLWTGFAVANVGASPVTITCTYANSAVTDSEANVASGGAMTVQNIGKLGGEYIGAATCSAPGGKIVAVVNELKTGANNDELLVYEGINR